MIPFNNIFNVHLIIKPRRVAEREIEHEKAGTKKTSSGKDEVKG